RRQAAAWRRKLLLIVISLHPLGSYVERLPRLHPQVAPRRGVVAPRLTHELHPAGRVGLIQLHRPAGEGPIAERRPTGAFEGVPHLDRYPVRLGGGLPEEPAPRQRAGDDEVLRVADAGAREQRGRHGHPRLEGKPARELIDVCFADGLLARDTSLLPHVGSGYPSRDVVEPRLRWGPR